MRLIVLEQRLATELLPGTIILGDTLTQFKVLMVYQLKR